MLTLLLFGNANSARNKRKKNNKKNNKKIFFIALIQQFYSTSFRIKNFLTPILADTIFFIFIS